MDASGNQLSTPGFHTQLQALLTVLMRTGAPLTIDIREHCIVFPDTVKVKDGTAVSMREVLHFLYTNPEYAPHARIFERQIAAVPEGTPPVVVPELAD